MLRNPIRSSSCSLVRSSFSDGVCFRCIGDDDEEHEEPGLVRACSSAGVVRVPYHTTRFFATGLGASSSSESLSSSSGSGVAVAVACAAPPPLAPGVSTAISDCSMMVSNSAMPGPEPVNITPCRCSVASSHDRM